MDGTITSAGTLIGNLSDTEGLSGALSSDASLTGEITTAEWGVRPSGFANFKIGEDTVSAESEADTFEFVSTDHIKAAKSGKGVRFDPYGLAPKDHAAINATYGIGTDELFGHVKLTHSIENPSSAVNAGVGITPYGVKTALDNLKTGVSDVKVLGKVTGGSTADYQTQVDGNGVALLDNADFGFASVQEAVSITPTPEYGERFGTSGQNGINLADGGIILIKFATDVLSSSAALVLGYDAPASSGSIPIYYNGSPISAGIIKANDVVALQYDNANNRWHLISRVLKQFGSTTEGIVPACGATLQDEIRILTSDGWQTVVTYGSYSSLNDYVSAVLVNPTLKTINNESLIGSGNITIQSGEANVQSDWNVTDTTSDAFIKNKPAIPTVPTNVSAFTNDAGYLTSYTETDPTVPAWAKASSKPTYTASEVGALPSSTSIPSKTSDLTNDSGFITLSDLPIYNGGVV